MTWMAAPAEPASMGIRQKGERRVKRHPKIKAVMYQHTKHTDSNDSTAQQDTSDGSNTWGSCCR
jgi:hypothetical protein